MEKRFRGKMYIIASDVNNDGHGPVAIAKAALAAGADVIQLRLKHHRTKAEAMVLAKRMRPIVARQGVLFIVNDYIDIAMGAGADGVHLGPDDLRVAAARKVWPEGIIGASISDEAEMERATLEGADYLAYGPLFATPTKIDAGAPVGLAGLRELADHADLPLVAIGGITLADVRKVLDAGADAIAMISAITAAKNMEKAARDVREEIDAWQPRQDTCNAFCPATSGEASEDA